MALMDSADEDVLVVSAPKQTVDVKILAAQGIANLKAIADELNDQFVERIEIVQDIIRAVVTKNHLFIMGPPGTAKSELTRAFTGHIDQANYFEWLLNKTSDPADILGPYSLKGMEKDKFERKSKGRLPEAHIVFLDEIWKSNEPTLNILLPIINERIFYNDGVPNDVPLYSMFCASNETPEDESLAALYDRLMFRHNAQYVKEPANKVKMAKQSVERRNPAIKTHFKHTLVTLEELEAIHEILEEVLIPDDIYKTFEKLGRELNKEGIYFSDRRYVACFKVLQGNALINGRTSVDFDDFVSLIHVLWEKEEHIKIIESYVMKLINPYDDKVKELYDTAIEIKNRTERIDNKTEKAGAAVEARVKYEQIVKKIERVIKDAQTAGRDVTNLEKKRDDIIKMNEEMIQEVLQIPKAAARKRTTTDDEEAMPF